MGIGITKEEIFELLESTDVENTYNLLLLGGPGWYKGPYDEYNTILKILELSK